MRQLTQSKVSELDGDCLPTALACITGIDDMPGFFTETWWGEFRIYLRERGWTMEDDPGTRPVPGYSVAVGASPIFPASSHACVALDGTVIWDPSPHRDDEGRAFKPTSFWPVREWKQS